MTGKQPNAPATSISLDDIYYALFRHKWLILGFFMLGLSAAVFIFFTSHPVFRSNASVLIRYISESKSMEEVADGTQVKSPDRAGRFIMNSELAILTSFDLAERVAGLVGPSKIFAADHDAAGAPAAASLIIKNLLIDIPPNSSVINISFAHAQPDIAHQVLQQIIEGYIKEHVRIHREVGIHDEDFRNQIRKLTNRIANAYIEIRDLRETNQVVSTEDEKISLLSEVARIRQELFISQITLEERLSLQGDSKTNKTTVGQAVPSVHPASADKASEYRDILNKLALLHNKELEHYNLKANHPLILGIREQITEGEKQKKNLEQKDPSLASLIVPSSINQPESRAISIPQLIVRTNALGTLLNKLVAEINSINDLDAKIKTLQGQIALDQTNLWNYSAAAEQTRIAGQLDAGTVSNISIIQNPTPPFKDPSGSRKRMAAALALGLFGGIGLALLIELVFNRRLRRPIEVENQLGLPLFISLPDFKKNGYSKRFRKKNSKLKSPPEEEGALKKASEATTSIQKSVRPFSEALRDRIMMFFQSKNLTHTPKLVAVTGCTPSSGVSTVATGLAATLSETGEGNVLLVDMNLPNAAKNPLLLGKPGCGLIEAIESGSRGVTPVQDHLYLASATDSHGNEVAIFPQRFTNLVPKIKASDFDYIIFDMPSVSQTSPTVGLAPFFDIMLMVVESEKTNRDLAKSAVKLLKNSKANLATVMNRKRNYLPRWLHQEL